MSFRKLMIIIIVCAGAGIGFFLWHSHKTGIAEGRNERHWLKDLTGGTSATEELSVSEEEYSSEYPGWTGQVQEEKEEPKKEITYTGFDDVIVIIGTDRFEIFKQAVEEDATIKTKDFSEATLADAEIKNTADYLDYFFQLNDNESSKYEARYHYSGDYAEIIPVTEFPKADDTIDEETQRQLEEKRKREEATAQQQAQSTSGSQSSSSGTSSSGSSAETTTETVEVKNYYTVNGVEFDNVAIYEVLSDEAVNIFTTEVKSWWSSNGESRRTIRTSTPVKNGSKVTFTVEYVDGGGSFNATLDLNKETFVFE